MLKNYLKIALRALRRHPGYAFINIAGLAVGLAACLMILLYVQDELAFDQHHHNADRIARVVEARSSPDQGDQHFAYTMGPLGPALVAEMPEVTNAVRVLGRWASGRMTVEHGPARFYSGAHLFAEPSVFEVFDYDLLRGDPATALAEPLTVVLTETTARTFFGTADPIGQTIQVERFGDFTVTGILRDPPPDVHLDFSMLFSFATLEAIEDWKVWIDNWESTSFLTYLVLAEGASLDVVAARLPALLTQHVPAEVQAERRVYLQPMTDVHFGSGGIAFEQNAHEANIAYVYIFSAIAFFLVLIACINYMNMATARSMRRAREVGLRKVVGAHRGQLIRQFLSESVMTAGIALVLALGLVNLLLPAFNVLAGKALTLGLGENAGFLAVLVGLVLVVGVVAGSYPAFFLSKFRPALVLKGGDGGGSGAARLRQGLVVTQFALSIVMIVATLVVYNQMHFVQTTQLGFNQEQLVVIDINNGDVRRDFETVKQAFAQVPAVRRVSVSSNVPGDWKGIPQIEVAPDAAPEAALTTSFFLGVDEDFLDTFELTLVDGRAFSNDFATDSTSVLLNETAAQRLGVAVGDQIRVDPASLGRRYREAGFRPRVAGIVRDFHFESLHQPIAPMVLGYRTNPIDVIDYFTARLDAADVPATVAALQAIGERFDPSHPFEYNFLGERLQDFYQNEQRVGTLFAMAAGLALFIACLGLFGLAAYTAERRTKEIGVRKVLGASAGSLAALLSKDFLWLVGLAFVLAVPLAYLAMDRWLDAFAYRVALGWPVFALAGLFALGVAVLTVSYQAVRAALADPVDSLRYE